MARMSRDEFIAATGTDQWATIDDLVKKLDAAGYWDDAFNTSAIDQKKKAHVRRRIRGLKDDEDWPLYANVTITLEDGTEQHVYKQEELFNRDDYFQVFSFHKERAGHHIGMAIGYQKRANKRLNMNIQLPLDWAATSETGAPPVDAPSTPL